jgi:ribosomal protein S18 acetylase RimI-like enzyme
LHHFGIKKSYQGKGLSNKLLDASLAAAKQMGMQIKLEVHKNNEIAGNLYRKAGFAALGDYEVLIIRDISSIQ